MSWTVLKEDGEAGRTVEPIPNTDGSEEFSMKIADEQPAGVEGNNGDICLSKVIQFCLPRLDCDVIDNGAAGSARPPSKFCLL